MNFPVRSSSFPSTEAKEGNEVLQKEEDKYLLVEQPKLGWKDFMKDQEVRLHVASLRIADRSVDFEASKHWERHSNESPRCFK